MMKGMETQSRTVLPVYVYAGTWASMFVTDKQIIVVFACSKIVYVNQTRLVNVNNFNH